MVPNVWATRRLRDNPKCELARKDYKLAVAKCKVLIRNYQIKKERQVSEASNVGTFNKFLWPPYAIRQAIIFLPCGFFYLLIPSSMKYLLSAVADWMFTILWHVVWP